jgi:integrase
VGEGGDGRRSSWPASCLDTDDRPPGGHRAHRRDTVRGDPDRSGKPYKPKTVRSYEHSLDTYIYPLLGSRKVSSLRRADIQGFVEEMRGRGAAPSTVHNRLDPLRVIVRRSIDNDELLVDPCARLKMPVVRNSRARIEPSTTAEALIAALPESEQAFWALALYAGVRRGELRGLQVDDIDFDSGLVRVRRGWDDLEGEISPKTFAGARDVPMVGELRRICRAHKLQTGRHGTQLFSAARLPTRSSRRRSAPGR